jgi:hypothetical protein
MKKIEIKTNEYKVITLQDDLVLYTINLYDEIAYSVFSFQLNKVGLGRNLSDEQLVQFFHEMNPDDEKIPGLIKVRIVGGDESEESGEALNKLILQLSHIDDNNDIIDIRACDTRHKLHPESFEVDCYHGGIRPISDL